jgi:hypothetical protein
MATALSHTPCCCGACCRTKQPCSACWRSGRLPAGLTHGQSRSPLHTPCPCVVPPWPAAKATCAPRWLPRRLPHTGERDVDGNHMGPCFVCLYQCLFPAKHTAACYLALCIMCKLFVGTLSTAVHVFVCTHPLPAPAGVLILCWQPLWHSLLLLHCGAHIPDAKPYSSCQLQVYASCFHRCLRHRGWAACGLMIPCWLS